MHCCSSGCGGTRGYFPTDLSIAMCLKIILLGSKKIMQSVILRKCVITLPGITCLYYTMPNIYNNTTLNGCANTASLDLPLRLTLILYATIAGCANMAKYLFCLRQLLDEISED